MSEIQNISEQIAKMKRVVNQLAQFLWDCNKLIDKHTLAIHNQLAGSADRSDRMVIDTLNAAQKQLNKAAEELLAAWTIAADWLEKVGGGSSSSVPASAGPIFLSSGDDPVRTEVTQESDSGESDTDGTVRSGDDPVQTEATQGNDGVGSDTAGSKPIKFKLSPIQTETTQESDGGKSATNRPVKYQFNPATRAAQVGKEEARKASEAWDKLLSEDERDAIRDYSGNDCYGNINGALRGLESAFHPGNKERAINIYTALQKASLPLSMTVYRGGDGKILGDLEGLSDNDIIGASFRDWGFISTSMSEGKAFGGGTMLRIILPKGCHAANIEHLSVYGKDSLIGENEEEILINGNQYFVITGVSYKDTTRIVDAVLVSKNFREVFK